MRPRLSHRLIAVRTREQPGLNRQVTGPAAPVVTGPVTPLAVGSGQAGQRAHRPALSPQAAADELCRDAQAGQLSPVAVQAVLSAADQPHRPVPRPAGLSERECEVLGLIAQGLATKQVARRLGISPKTCDHHIQRLYRKIGLSTRAGATLFALEHGLIHPD